MLVWLSTTRSQALLSPLASLSTYSTVVILHFRPSSELHFRCHLLRLVSCLYEARRGTHALLRDKMMCLLAGC